MSLIQSLPEGPLDIVGDIHGEFDALLALLSHLGYDLQGHHPQGRTLVFVGDFCDRGPNSPAVLALVQKLVQSGRAAAVLGNHEINLLREDAKDGSGWFFDARVARDHDKYAPFQRPTPQERQDIVQFLSALPIGLERADLRVIHAAWQDEQIEAARRLPLGSVRAEYDQWEHIAQQQARETALAERMARELEQWEHGLENSQRQPPFLHAHAEYESSKQMLNPLKVLTSGVEQKGSVPFFSGGKWRFAQRMPWWDAYTEATPVVVGHYWRRVHQIDPGRWVRAMRTCLPGPTRSLGTASGAMCSAWIFQRAGAGWSASQEPWWATISSWLHCAGPSGCCSLTMGTFRPPRALAYSRAL